MKKINSHHLIKEVDRLFDLLVRRTPNMIKNIWGITTNQYVNCD